MKLSARYNRVTLAISVIILLFTGIIYYLVIHFILTDRLDKDLEIEENEIAEYVETYNKLPLPGDFKDQKVEYKVVRTKPVRIFLNTDYKNESGDETEPGRSLITTLVLKNTIYQITITKSRVQAEDLIRIIFLITLGITVLLLISLMLINRFVIGQLWKPFYSVLDQMKAFNIADKKDILPDPTRIDEFKDLNGAAITLTKRVKQDYRDLKSFTDNASHEMMTPLAVINSKLDTLLQGEPLTNAQGKLIEDMYDAIGRLSRLNQSLLLLAKIENNLINDQEDINLKELVEQKFRQFQELIRSSQLVDILELDEKTLRMSRYLADILLNNLISNAIRHNIPNGEIRVVLSSEYLQITNTGNLTALNVKEIFERFNKSASSEGMGLGLAISKQICSLNNFSLQYTYTSDAHNFLVIF